MIFFIDLFAPFCLLKMYFCYKDSNFSKIKYYFCRKFMQLRRIISIAFLLTSLVVMRAQISFTTHLNKVSDKELSLVFRATIEDGYHLNTDFVLEEHQGISLKGRFKEVSPNVYEQRILITSPQYSFSGYMEYYGCNDVQCLAPESVEFDYKAAAPSNSPSGREQTAAAPKDTAAPMSSPLGESEGAEVTAFSLFERANSPLWTPIVEELKQLSESPVPLQRSLFEIFLICFLGGLLTILTPCVWPVIPLTVSFFIKRSETSAALPKEEVPASPTSGEYEGAAFYSSYAEGDDRGSLSQRLWRTVVRYSRLPGVHDALWYGASIIVLFMGLGIVMTLLFGVNAMNALSTNAVFNVLCFFLLVAFGLSFLGFFEIRLPASWANKFDTMSHGNSGFLGMAFMALTLVVVSFSCTVPVLGYLLVEIAVQGSILAPAVGMFGFSLAIALPFALFAIFPMILKRLPRSGYWMDHIKKTLGFIELAFSLKFLSVADMSYGWGILPRWLFLVLWIVIFLFLALYHTEWLHFRRTGWIRRFIAVSSLFFVIYLIPGLWGAPCTLVSAFAPPPSETARMVGTSSSMREGGGKSAPYSLPVHYSDYEEGMAAAAMTGKPVLLDFTGYGCVNCRKMESSVWREPNINKIINRDYLVIMLHVDDRTPLPEPQRVMVNGKERPLRSVGDMWSYLESYKFGSISQPFYVLLTPDGKPLAQSYGYDEDTDKYLRFLKLGLAKYKQL